MKPWIQNPASPNKTKRAGETLSPELCEPKLTSSTNNRLLRALCWKLKSTGQPPSSIPCWRPDPMATCGLMQHTTLDQRLGFKSKLSHHHNPYQLSLCLASFSPPARAQGSTGFDQPRLSWAYSAQMGGSSISFLPGLLTHSSLLGAGLFLWS